MYGEHPHLFLQLRNTSLCECINRWFNHFSIDGHLGLFPIFHYFKCTSFHVFPQLLVLEVGLLDYRTSVIFARCGAVLLHRDYSACSLAMGENFVSPRSDQQSILSYLWLFSLQHFNPVLSSLALLGKATQLLPNICRIRLIKLWNIHRGYVLEMLANQA